MRVLIISHMYPSNFNNIAGIFVHEQAMSLIKKGCDVTVISPVPFAGFPINLIRKKWKRYYDIPKKNIIDGIEVYYPRYFELPNSYYMENSGTLMYLGIKKLYNELNNNYHFDILHSHVALPDGFAGCLLNKKNKIPHVVTIHGQDLQFTIFKNNKCRSNVLKVYEEADKIIAVSNKLKNINITDIYKNKVIVINNGINLEQYKNINNSINEFDEKMLLNEDDFIILSVSNLINSKGIYLNIKAVSILVKKHPNIKYFIVGDGEDRKHLVNMVQELNLSKNVLFLGKMSHNDALKIMNLCNVFCLPSWQEGFGTVYIEAMAAGKPTIGVYGEGIEDIIIDGENGFLVNPKNVDDIVEKIEFIIDFPEKANEISEKGKECIISKHTWDKVAEELICIYENLLEKK